MYISISNSLHDFEFFTLLWHHIGTLDHGLLSSNDAVADKVEKAALGIPNDVFIEFWDSRRMQQERKGLWLEGK